jgi:hypothetical protein
MEEFWSYVPPIWNCGPSSFEDAGRLPALCYLMLPIRSVAVDQKMKANKFIVTCKNTLLTIKPLNFQIISRNKYLAHWYLGKHPVHNVNWHFSQCSWFPFTVLTRLSRSITELRLILRSAGARIETPLAPAPARWWKGANTRDLHGEKRPMVYY